MAEETIKACYQQILKRPAEKQGIARWTAYLATGHSPKETVRLFGYSTEFKHTVIFQNTPMEAARICCERFLGRTGTDEALIHHVQHLVNYGHQSIVD